MIRLESQSENDLICVRRADCIVLGSRWSGTHGVHQTLVTDPKKRKAAEVETSMSLARHPVKIGCATCLPRMPRLNIPGGFGRGWHGAGLGMEEPSGEARKDTPFGVLGREWACYLPSPLPLSLTLARTDNAWMAHIKQRVFCMQQACVPEYRRFAPVGRILRILWSRTTAFNC